MNEERRELSKELRDEKTPNEVRVFDAAREPILDPRLGVEVPVTVKGRPRHRLVTIGDSLTQGF